MILVLVLSSGGWVALAQIDDSIGESLGIWSEQDLRVFGCILGEESGVRERGLALLEEYDLVRLEFHRVAGSGSSEEYRAAFFFGGDEQPTTILAVAYEHDTTLGSLPSLPADDLEMLEFGPFSVRTDTIEPVVSSPLEFNFLAHVLANFEGVQGFMARSDLVGIRGLRTHTEEFGTDTLVTLSLLSGDRGQVRREIVEVKARVDADKGFGTLEYRIR